MRAWYAPVDGAARTADGGPRAWRVGFRGALHGRDPARGIELFGAERVGEQGPERGTQEDRSLRIRDDDRGVLAELADHLAAGAARRRGVIARGDDRHRLDAAGIRVGRFADQAEDRIPLGAGGEAV